MLDSGDAAEPRVMALNLLTLLETPEADADQVLRDRLGDRLLSLVVSKDAGQAKLNQGAMALSLAALATLYERTRDEQLGQAVWAMMDRLWGSEERVPNLVALPWLVLAYERAGDLLADADASGMKQAQLAKRRAVLAAVIDRLCQYQVIEIPELGPDDVLGGFVLKPGPSGSPPNPDWRNAQALMFLSVMLRDENATQDRDKLGWLLSAGYSARFVGQLMMDDAACYYVRDRTAAHGGVRMAPWDNRLALAPTAISLLAVTELQASLTSFKPPVPTPDSITEEDGGEDELTPNDSEGVPVDVTTPDAQP
ncbi:MAG: hypothetical protein JKY51_07245 [Opitutaceae bacterium]|nr:hypothetical protein [Opitutaceae bacterium]